MGLPSVDPTTPPNGARRLATALAMTGPGTWFLKHVSKRVDPWLLRASRGRVSTVVVTPVVLLTSTGARTGRQRTVPLVYFTDGEGGSERVVLMASNYGGKRHPAWYHNVRAHPEVTMTAGGHTGRFIGREASGEDYERLWGLAQQLTRAYSRYQGMTEGRKIPVLTFTPT